jgi:hypothetical protein
LEVLSIEQEAPQAVARQIERQPNQMGQPGQLPVQAAEVRALVMQITWEARAV